MCDAFSVGERIMNEPLPDACCEDGCVVVISGKVRGRLSSSVQMEDTVTEDVVTLSISESIYKGTHNYKEPVRALGICHFFHWNILLLKMLSSGIFEIAYLAALFHLGYLFLQVKRNIIWGKG